MFMIDPPIFLPGKQKYAYSVYSVSSKEKNKSYKVLEFSFYLVQKEKRLVATVDILNKLKENEASCSFHLEVRSRY